MLLQLLRQRVGEVKDNSGCTQGGVEMCVHGEDPVTFFSHGRLPIAVI
jgi:hypothetical protein